MHRTLGFQPVILICLIGLFAFLASKKAIALWRKVTTHDLFTPFIVFPALIVLLSFIVVLCLALANAFTAKTQSTLPVVLWFARSGWLHYWGIFSLCFWWLCVMPLTLWFSRIFLGIREQCQVIYVLFWPIIWATLASFSHTWQWHLGNHIVLDAVIMVGGVIVFCVLIAMKSSWQTLVRGYIQQPLSGHRPARKLLRNISMSSLIAVYIFWQSSVIGMTFMLLLIALPVALLSIASLLRRSFLAR